MKNAFLSAAASVAFSALLALTLRPGPVRAAQTAAPSPEQTIAASAAAATEIPLFHAQTYDRSVLLPVLREGEIVRMDLHTYLTGVLLAELPPDFSDEARKAQAVACRTYALRSDARRRHEEAAVCTDSACCMGWTDPAAVSAERRAQAEAAVDATDGLAIFYDGRLIDATFFSCSGGMTEDAAAVWGGDLPYLRSVPSPGEEGAAHFSDEKQVSLAEFQSVLRSADPAVSFPEQLGAWVGTVTRTAGGGVDVMVLGGRPFRGTELRKLFGLRSTAFTLTLTDETASFTTSGYGHRVGLSQYGAEAMAREGKSFREILIWYYRGVTVETAPG